MQMSSTKKSHGKPGMDGSSGSKGSSSTADPQVKDVIAFVRYLAQNFVVSLNPYDGLEQWQKVLSGLAPGPVEIVLLPDNTASGSLQGISIVDRRSYMEAMKIVERVRGHDVLRFVLYPIKDETGAVPQIHPGRSNELGKNSPWDCKSSVSNSECKETMTMDQSYPSTTDISVAHLENKLQNLGETCPQWADDLRKDIMELVDKRFQELSVSLETSLSMLGSQVTQSIGSQANVSSSSRGSVGGSDTSLVVVPTLAEMEKCSQGDDAAVTVSLVNSAVPAWINNLPPCTSPERAENAPEAFSSQLSSGSTLSESGSIVVVTPPESFDLMGFGDTSGGQMAESLDVATKEQLNQMLEQASETGSVVYVETDGEEDDDFTHLRTWAEDASSVNTSIPSTESVPLGESFQSVKSVTSLNNSFHSITSGQEEPVQDTIVYKSFPLPSPPPSVPDSFRYETPYEGNTESSDNVEVRDQPDENTRPTPINGSAMLPPDLNAMQPIDEQNLFSPSSDIGTMLLSAASSIATGFIQSMESLSKTISAYEERRLRALAEHHRNAASAQTEPEPLVMESVHQEEVPAEADSGEADDFQSAEEQCDPPPLPPRTFRGPPPSNGAYMSPDEIDWYLREYGISVLVRDSWGNRPVTREEFNERINDYFDRRG